MYGWKLSVSVSLLLSSCYRFELVVYFLVQCDVVGCQCCVCGIVVGGIDWVCQCLQIVYVEVGGGCILCGLQYVVVVCQVVYMYFGDIVFVQLVGQFGGWLLVIGVVVFLEGVV